MRIVRVLWGENLPAVRWTTLWQGIEARQQTDSDCEQSVYVYGRENADRLKRICKPNYEIVLVDDNPYPHGERDQALSRRNVIRPWRYKHELLLCAVRDHGPVIYCDWDVRCLVRDVAAAFAKVEQRRFRLSAFRYKMGHNHYSDWPGVEGQVVASGSWIYTHDDWFPRQVLAKIIRREHPHYWHDERVMSDLIVSWHDGWPTETVWLMDYESPIMVRKGIRSPWPLLYRDKDVDGRVVRRTPFPFAWTGMFLAQRE